MTADHGDPADARTWFRLLVWAIDGLHRGDQTHAREYLQFVETHRGRAQAEQARETLKRYAAHEAFDNTTKLMERLDRHDAKTSTTVPAKATPRPAPRRKVRGGGLIHPQPVQAGLT